MYKDFFGLHSNPFNINPDPRYLFWTRHAEEALACLTYGVENRKGFVLLTGEVGTGKTTLVNKLLDRLREQNIAAALVFNPRMNARQFLNYVLTDFGISEETVSKSKNRDEVLRDLNNWLLDRYRSGQTAVLIVDEAQDLSEQLLEEIRLLTNLETSTDKLLQVVLVGQPELEHKLKQPNLRQLRQRITLWAKTELLSLDETAAYVAERLRIAGSNGENIFDSSALLEIHRFSGGIPRIVNLICENCLVFAFADQKKQISKEAVEVVARDFDLNDGVTCPSSNFIPATRKVPLAKAELVEALKTITAWLTEYGERSTSPSEVEVIGEIIQAGSKRGGLERTDRQLDRLAVAPKTPSQTLSTSGKNGHISNPAEIWV